MTIARVLTYQHDGVHYNDKISAICEAIDAIRDLADTGSLAFRLSQVESTLSQHAIQVDLFQEWYENPADAMDDMELPNSLSYVTLLGIEIATRQSLSNMWQHMNNLTVAFNEMLASNRQRKVIAP